MPAVSYFPGRGEGGERREREKERERDVLGMLYSPDETL